MHVIISNTFVCLRVRGGVTRNSHLYYRINFNVLSIKIVPMEAKRRMVCRFQQKVLLAAHSRRRKPGDSLPEIRCSSEWIMAQWNLLSCSYIVSWILLAVATRSPLLAPRMSFENGDMATTTNENCTRGQQYLHTCTTGTQTKLEYKYKTIYKWQKYKISQKYPNK